MSQAPADELRQAIDQHAGCEVALLAEPAWAAEGSTRIGFSQALAEGLATLGSADHSPTTLALPAGRLAAHEDMLVRHGISAVRVAARRQPGVRRWWRRDRSVSKAIGVLRWGLWEVAANIDLSAVGLAAAERLVDRITRQGGVAVVAADARTLESQAKRLPRLLDHLQRRRDENALRIDTVAASVARQQVPRQTPSRSILRPAA
ncbi:MAG TPA: hypothetical protein VG125_16690 [Pirellulales bacterium]|nr:hypothetical protein [Pirellulales bacterium]